ncbi:TetR/AcrR family transcriptional regulator [Micromonospora sp. NBC_01796]|uniref:TetR/AcrR family transcriptional regulator n=1 Tax=Micromonospora sp. NBC_01796 TaxID=2975987 RepID=UPI002DDAAF1D|nr:helix-turn-helix domain-containing protein [Micromonospora sp. NBC_01796]WSA85629.1 TetR/AcrR family transcriptional regulator [Micromonospora sp. NBC_01796]
MTGTTGSHLRADAKINHDRVLDAARRAFARDGADASLREIAKDAGVGIGTLYRRFPTREDLVWVVYRSEVDRLCGTVTDLLVQHPPAIALYTWMQSFLDFLATKRAMADVLKVALARDEDQRLEVRERVTTALATLLAAGAAQGSIRADIAAFDVVMALGGISLIAGEADQRAQATRQLDLLMAALRPVPSGPPAGRR